MEAHLDASFCHCTEETHDVGDATASHHHASTHQSLGNDLAQPYPFKESGGLFCMLSLLDESHAFAKLGSNVGHGIHIDAFIANV